MLRQRVRTAILLLTMAIAAIFMLPAQWFLILLAIVLLAGTVEYARLAGLTEKMAAYLLVFVQVVVLAGLYSQSEHWNTDSLFWLAASCITWMLMFVRLPMYRPKASVDKRYQLISIITAIASITTGWFALGWIRIQPEGPWLILLLLLIVWAADTGAYFSGKKFGKTKLAPQISPGKTVAGLVGGLVTASLVALMAIHWMPIASIESSHLVLLALITALVSAGGDLMISMHKRTSGYKDSGRLLPGHGGILDRIDSLLAAAPFFALGLLLTGI